MHDLKIVGSPGSAFGNAVVKTGGSSTIEFSGDTIRVYQKRLFGLETVEALVPIEEVESVETGRGCTWWLVWLGVVTLAILNGVVFIVLGFVTRQRFLVIHTSSIPLVIFPTGSEDPKAFAQGIMQANREARG